MTKPKKEYLSEKPYGDVKVVRRRDRKWGVVDSEGNEIVPFGKYTWIDAFSRGLARVKIGAMVDAKGDEVSPLTSYNWVHSYDFGYNERGVSLAFENEGDKWGIIDIHGTEVVPVVYDKIWNFKDFMHDYTTAEKDGEREVLDLTDYFDELLDEECDDYDCYDDYDSYDDYGTHYGEFEGSYAQDVMGYSDDVINDAFEGDPDCYWNID